jgi:hypothetical protein
MYQKGKSFKVKVKVGLQEQSHMNVERKGRKLDGYEEREAEICLVKSHVTLNNALIKS